MIDDLVHDDHLCTPVVAPDALANIYHAFQKTLNVNPAPSNNSLKSLVTFDDARTEPVHRWYSFKEGYSHRLLDWLLEQDLVPAGTPLSLLDPYCGVGTTLLSSMLSPHAERVILAAGVERNPAIYSIAQAKLNWSRYSIGRIEALIGKLGADAGRGNLTFPIPSLSTFSKVRRNGKRAFVSAALQDLLYYRDWIRNTCGSTAEGPFFMLAWTSIIEKASNTRKDGRALRLIPEAALRHVDVKEMLLAQCDVMLDDLVELSGRLLESSVCLNRLAYLVAGDARCLPFADSGFNMICYSPPYLNNIDYTEVYKLELWLREDVTTQDEFKALRISTFRSHPSVLFPTTMVCDSLDEEKWIVQLKAALLAALPDDRFRHMRRWLFAGYIDDLILSLREQYRVAKPGASIICVVGNSLHGGQQRIPVCTDLLIAAAAQAVGLVVDRLQVARQLPRRDHQNGWLRETIIVMHKPNAPKGH